MDSRIGLEVRRNRDRALGNSARRTLTAKVPASALWCDHAVRSMIGELPCPE